MITVHFTIVNYDYCTFYTCNVVTENLFFTSECNMTTKGIFPGLKYRHLGKSGFKVSNLILGEKCKAFVFLISNNNIQFLSVFHYFCSFETNVVFLVFNVTFGRTFLPPKHANRTFYLGGLFFIPNFFCFISGGGSYFITLLTPSQPHVKLLQFIIYISKRIFSKEIQ